MKRKLCRVIYAANNKTQLKIWILYYVQISLKNNLHI